ncbi:MAG: ribonuclease P protein subunit [Nitrososphaeraceae archaeon]|nr:ribonuclease P protein subunit [Nitrososphaeraceae archaeon]
MITIDNVLHHELIGLYIKILHSKQINCSNLLGKIVFETKNMLVLRTNQGVKKIPKNTIIICALYLPLNVCFISGYSMIGRPEDRVLRNRR